MSSVKYPLVGGRVMRLTRLDLCGRPAYGDRARVVSDGFVSVAVTANYDDGTEISVTNANGRRCVQRDAEAELTNLSLEVTFCDVDPDLYTAFTGFPREVDPVTGATVGFRVTRRVRPTDVRNALEVWSNAAGTSGCEGDEDVPFGYLLWPFLSGARVGDYTIENGAVTFTVSGALTKDGSLWGEGPYDVINGAGGAASRLDAPIDSMEHQVVRRTTVAPPEPTNGLVPLDDPDGDPATTATAGTPGTFNGTRPETFADLEDSSITASPSSAWSTGQYVVLGSGQRATWDGDSWVLVD